MFGLFHNRRQFNRHFVLLQVILGALLRTAYKFPRPLKEHPKRVIHKNAGRLSQGNIHSALEQCFSSVDVYLEMSVEYAYRLAEIGKESFSVGPLGAVRADVLF